MVRQSDERKDFSGCRRSELVAIAAEQAQTLLDLRTVLYRETDALREELRMLQAENRALKETLSSTRENSVQPAMATMDEEALKEKLRPIVKKLVARHRQETDALLHKLAALQTELAEEREKHSEAQRQLELNIRESEKPKHFLAFEQLSRRFTQEEGTKPVSSKPLSVPGDKLLPFVRDNSRQ